VEKRKKHIKKGEPQTITRAVTHIRLNAANPGKLAALDHLVQVFLSLIWQHVTLFCTDEFCAPCFSTSFSEGWHRVAIQQATGIATSRRPNRTKAFQEYVDALADFRDQQTEGQLPDGAKKPEWCEWQVPVLRQPRIQANTNVVQLEWSTASTFDGWFKISTLDKGKPLLVPIQLSDCHKAQLTDPKLAHAAQSTVVSRSTPAGSQSSAYALS